LWQRHFGQGLVVTPGNFGTAGARPTHPELLDWLAVEFVRHDWSIKSLHRLMLTSRTYRQSSQITEPAAERDPDGRLLSRMPLRRMEGEVVRDSLLALAGRLDQRQFGAPDPVDVRADGLVTAASSHSGGRRSVFVLQRRTTLPTLLEGFDAPEMNPNCLERRESIVSPQALHLLNNQTVYGLAGDFAERVRRDAGEDREAQIEAIHLLAYARLPDHEERAVAIEMLDRLTSQWSAHLADTASDPIESYGAAARRALHNYCHAVMNSAAFLYID
jgi:hypothetical protein